MTAIGRILSSQRDEGTGFALGRRLVVTANHVVRDCDHATLWFSVAEHRIAIERVETDEGLDVAVLYLAEDAPGELAVGDARCDALWRVESRPRDNDPLLTGRINATDRSIVNRGGKSVQVIQLLVDQALGWHAGYSGSPVTSPEGVAVGVLVEQVLSRAPQSPGQPSAASNVLYAIPIEAVLERFRLAGQARRAPSTAVIPAPVAERVSGDRVSPNVEHWRDRDELRAELRRLLLAGEHRVISVVGRRGIGKSALVAKVLLEFEEDDPARDPLEDLSPLVYLSTRRSADLTLPYVFEAVAAVWGDAGRPLAEQWQQRGSRALPEMWHKLRDRRPVLVLDNLDDLQDPITRELEDPELVALLDSACLTPASPTVVTTSQHSLELPDDLASLVRVLEVPEGLTGADAVSVIRSAASSGADRLATISDAELTQLAERVEGRPRGLQKLGHMLDKRPRLRRQLLKSESAPDEVVDELVSTSYAVLPGDERLVVQLLALSRSPLSETAVAELLRGLLDAGATVDAIDAVVDAGEVRSNSRDELLDLHPLDADYVRRELVEHERPLQVELDLRLANWWAARRKPFVEWRALDDATPSKREYSHRWRAGQHAQALAVLAEAARFVARTGEGHLIAAAVHAAARDVDQADLVARFHACRCRSLIERFAGSLDESLEALRSARELGIAAGLGEEITDIDIEIGKVLRYKGDADAAVHALRAIAEGATRVPATRAQRQAALFDLGLSLLYRRDVQCALEVANELDALVRPGDPVQVRAARADIRALTSIVTEDWGTAEAAAAEGVELFLQTPYQTDAGYQMNVRALALLGSGGFVDAIAQLDEGLRMAEDYRDDRLEGFCATNLAWALLHEGQLDGALQAAERGAERLASNGVNNAFSPSALAEAIRAYRGGDVASARAALAAASELALGNPDIKQPDAAFLDAAAVALARQ